MPLQFDPDFLKGFAPIMAAKAAAPKTDLTNPLAIRAALNPFFEKLMELLPEPVGIEHEIHEVPSRDGTCSIRVYRYWKNVPGQKPGPAILNIHGGGLMFGSPEIFKKSNALLVQNSGVQVFSVAYRLAPEHAFPVPVEDCYSALEWLHEKAEDFAIDTKRIITLGESAGAGLVVSVNLMARDRGLNPPVAKQVLIYPMLDDRNVTPASPELEPFLTWMPEASLTAWKHYLGSDYGTDRVSEYAAPARAASVKGLPSTYLEIGTFDIFYKEDVDFMERIKNENIEHELHIHECVPHGYDFFVPFGKAATKAMADRLKAIAQV